MGIDLDAPIRFLRTQFMPDDWVAILLKSHDTGGTAQRVGPVSLIASPKFQAWLRAENARRFSVFVSVNAIRPQRKARTREAIGEIRHVFLDADRDGPAVLAAIAARRDLPSPNCVIHTSPNRLHVLWRVTGFSKAGVELLQKRLARELGTDRAATSCAQLTRVPGFINHKYRPGAAVSAGYTDDDARHIVQFPAESTRMATTGVPTEPRPQHGAQADVTERARRYIETISPAIAGSHGDASTFRVCCRLVRGFALTDEQALKALRGWNERCEPPWTTEELRQKLASARQYGREPFGGLADQRYWLPRTSVDGYPKRLPKRPPVG